MSTTTDHIRDMAATAQGTLADIETLRECNSIGCEPPEELISGIESSLRFIMRAADDALEEVPKCEDCKKSAIVSKVKCLECVEGT